PATPTPRSPPRKLPLQHSRRAVRRRLRRDGTGHRRRTRPTTTTPGVRASSMATRAASTRRTKVAPVRSAESWSLSNLTICRAQPGATDFLETFPMSEHVQFAIDGATLHIPKDQLLQRWLATQLESSSRAPDIALTISNVPRIGQSWPGHG